MADCSYARCLQERRGIKRELQRWTKNMVYVVGLERVAEELMGSRKWKLYQNVLLARNLPLQQPPPPSEAEDDDPLEEDEDEAEATENAEETVDRQRRLRREPEEEDRRLRRQSSSPTSQQQALKEADRESPPPSMIATATGGCADAPPPSDHPHPQQQPCGAVPSPIALDADDSSSKDAADEPRQQQIGLKIKTIEQINTVGVDADQDPAAAAATAAPPSATAAAASTGGAPGSGTGETILEGLIKRKSVGPPRRPLPADWTPQDKCYFCVDGKLVRPSGVTGDQPQNNQQHQHQHQQQQQQQPEQAPSPAESESAESSSSRSGASPPRNQFLLNSQTQAQALAQFLLHQQQQQARLNPSMNTVQSMTASLAALAALSGGGAPGLPGLAMLPPATLLPHLFLNSAIRANNTSDRSMTNERDKDASSPLTAAEQPLDLSSKSSSGQDAAAGHQAAAERSMTPSSLESRSRPRVMPAARRTYSEHELQAALREIQSGRLGTRRAAVLYNIPRSTLRNKVYKLEREKESRVPGSHVGSMDRDDSNDIVDDLEDDKDSSIMEEDKDDDKELPRPPLSMEDMLGYQQQQHADPAAAAARGNSESLRMLLQNREKFFDLGSPKRDVAAAATAVPDAAAAAAWAGLDPNILTLLLASGLPHLAAKPSGGDGGGGVPEIMRNILKEQLMKQQDHMNGKSLGGEHHSHHHQQHDADRRLYSRQSSSASSIHASGKNERSTPNRRTESPDEPMEIADEGESRDSPPKVILNVPSFKSNNASKNGSGDAATSPLPYFSRSPHADGPPRVGHFSPPLGAHHAKTLALKDVIANSINQKFHQHSPNANHNDLQQHHHPQSHHHPHQHHLQHHQQMKAGGGADFLDSLGTAMGRGAKPPSMGQGISVITKLAGHDLGRHPSNSSAASNQSSQNNSSGGGKGTRPKRGKYRNYDRDSLVEAVKAVQRGEMSVHRAGSYYGVPHSTLEYKVKERHLMRPRKREPKNLNPDEHGKSVGGGVPSAGKPPSETPKGPPAPPKPPAIGGGSAGKAFPASSPNGMKMPPGMFDPALGLAGYGSPFPFWPHAPAFPTLPGAGAAGSGYPSTESLFASHMMQKLQESKQAPPPPQQQQPPQMFNSEGVSAAAAAAAAGSNGGASFLEGIIRSSLEQGQDAASRRLRQDDMMLAEEMREAVRRVREASARAATSSSSTTPAPASAGSSPTHTA